MQGFITSLSTFSFVDMTGNTAIGLAGVVVAALFWGSNFTVVKKYDMPSDGIHFSFLMSIGILFAGILTLLSSPLIDGDFEVMWCPLGVLGGAMWAMGNFLTVPIVQRTGLGIGLAMWGGTNMIVAFVVGALGLEGIGINLPKEQLTHPVCGLTGVVFALSALVVFSQVKTRVNPLSNDIPQDQQEALLSNTWNNTEEAEENPTPPETEVLGTSTTETTPCSTLRRRWFEVEEPTAGGHNVATNQLEEGESNVAAGIAMAVIAGSLYGFMFVPLQIWKSKVTGKAQIFGHDLPSDMQLAFRFYFSQFSGIFLLNMTVFLVYCGTTQNRPKLVPSNAFMPSILCGALWSVGCAAALLATTELGNAVGFPLVLNGSFLVNSAWSVFVYREIEGKRNLQLFGGAFLLNILSSLFVSASKA